MDNYDSDRIDTFSCEKTEKLQVTQAEAGHCFFLEGFYPGNVSQTIQMVIEYEDCKPMVIEKKDCTIHWICPESRLFACEHGFFKWHEATEKTYTDMCCHGAYPNAGGFAAALGQAQTQACMSQDGAHVEMILARFGGPGMYFEVTPAPPPGTDSTHPPT
jgi:hypothetical protein